MWNGISGFPTSVLKSCDYAHHALIPDDADKMYRTGPKQWVKVGLF